MSYLNSLKPYFLAAAFGFGLVLFSLLSPITEYEALMLIWYGVTIRDFDRQINPRPDQPAEGPLLPWNQMDVGDKLEYFFAAMSFTVVGVLISVITLLDSEPLVEKWPLLVSGLCIAGCGTALGYWNWLHRCDAVESE